MKKIGILGTILTIGGTILSGIGTYFVCANETRKAFDEFTAEALKKDETEEIKEEEE